MCGTPQKLRKSTQKILFSGVSQKATLGNNVRKLHAKFHRGKNKENYRLGEEKIEKKEARHP